MSDSQDYLLYYMFDVPGEDLLKQSANNEEEPMEEEVVIVEEVQFRPPEPAESTDPGYMLACGERDIFDEDVTYTFSQLMVDLNTPNSGGSWSSCPFSRGGGGP